MFTCVARATKACTVLTLLKTATLETNAASAFNYHHDSVGERANFFEDHEGKNKYDKYKAYNDELADRAD